MTTAAWTVHGDRRSAAVLGRLLGLAFRRGRRYGNPLVDIETGRPVDMLPDRSSETLAAWLTDHPGVEIVCRDRAAAYTRAIKEAAPHAMEIADRWHLLPNLSSAVEKACHQHRGCRRKRLEDEQLPTVEVPDVPPVLLLAELPRTSMAERTRHRHADVHRMLERGWTISAIGRHLGLDRKTVRRSKNTDLDVLLSSAQDRQRRAALPGDPRMRLSRERPSRPQSPRRPEDWHCRA
ncbi:transposase [Streptomyces sp. NPDC002676]